jgi:cation diffusion facilitator family transporter
MNGIHTLSAGSVLIGLIVLGLKYYAYYLTGSVALLSDAIESIVNVATAVVTLLAIRWSSQPADDEHPYGHHKVEYFSAVIEGVLIIVVLWERGPQGVGDLVSMLRMDFGTLSPMLKRPETNGHPTPVRNALTA